MTVNCSTFICGVNVILLCCFGTYFKSSVKEQRLVRQLPKDVCVCVGGGPKLKKAILVYVIVVLRWVSLNRVSLCLLLLYYHLRNCASKNED